MNALVTLKPIYFDQFYHGILRFSAAIFPQKIQYLVNGESDQKSVTSKKDAKPPTPLNMPY